MSDDNKLAGSDYDDFSYSTFDGSILDELTADFDKAFDKMQDMQEKDISARLLKAQKELDKIDADLLEFLKVEHF